MRLAVIGSLLALLGRCVLPNLSQDPERLCGRAALEAPAADLAAAFDPEQRLSVTVCERRHVIVQDAEGRTYERRQSEAATCRLPARAVARGELSVRACRQP